MQNIGLLRAMKLCKDYAKMDGPRRAALQARRLDELVRYARERSPYYAALYKDLPSCFSLTDLPPVNKRELMERWDDWVTDRSVTLRRVNAFMENPDNVGRWMDGKYLVFTTSGSTGNPLVSLCDRTANNVMGGVNALRSFARREDLRAFILRGGKTMGVFATGGFYLSNGSVRSRLLAMPWKKRQMAVTSALLPLGEIVEQLNAFQPAMLGGYPSHLELLGDEARAGRLRVSPALVMTGGEYLSDALRQSLSEAFHCYVQTSYSCTEGGSVACECKKRRFHLNDDWVLAEPVDAENRPVAPGQRSDKILLTNFSNYTLPFIRYEVTDRVVLHDEPCECGNPSPWLELEGRSDDVVEFAANGEAVKVAPLSLYAVLKEAHALRRFQLTVWPGNRAEISLESAPGVSREEAFNQACQALRAYLLTQGIRDVAYTLSSLPPRQQPGSGKFKHILNGKGARP